MSSLKIKIYKNNKSNTNLIQYLYINMLLNRYDYSLSLFSNYYHSLSPVVLTFYRSIPGATEFSDRATTDRGRVSGITSGYKIGANYVFYCRVSQAPSCW